MRKSRVRFAIALVVVLAIVDAAVWGLLLHRSPSKTAYVSAADTQTLTPAATPAPSASPSTPAPSASPSTPALPDPSSGPLRYAIIGDSIGSGRFASAPDKTYAALMTAAVEARGPAQAQAVTPGQDATLSVNVTVPADLDLVFVELGTDDLAKATPQSFGYGLAVTLNKIRADSPDAIIVCAGTWSATGSEFDEAIRRDCTAVSGLYVSMTDAYADAANRGPAGTSTPFGTSDATSPNDAGHKAIATAMLRAVGLQPA